MFWSESHKIITEDITKRVEFFPCDLSDITDVKKVVDSLVGKLDRLDMLINNAGQRSLVKDLGEFNNNEKIFQLLPITRFPLKVSKRFEQLMVGQGDNLGPSSIC